LINPGAINEEMRKDTERDKDWFRPCSYNDYKLITRIIIALNDQATNGNITNMIVFDQPAYEDYQINNLTDYGLSFTKLDSDDMQFQAINDEEQTVQVQTNDNE